MKLSIDKELSNNIYKVTVSITETPKEDTDLFHDFGDVVIQTGGELKGADGTTLRVLPEASRKFPSQFPITQRFPDSQYDNKGKEVANAWAESVTKRIETELEKLRLKTDDFTGKEELTI